MPLSTSYAICEAFGWEAGISKDFREAPVFMGLFTLLLVIGSLVVLSPSVPLFPLILVSQNVNGLLLPIVLVFMVLLINDKRLMGDRRNGRIANVLAWSAVGIVVVLDAVLLGVAALGLLGVQVG
jgi:Mn2+/Fe2+ NRAMP family transporter